MADKYAQVEVSRLQMQCFKGAWISNVLHEGIGIPRLGDVGGNDTLTGGGKGDTNAEAARRAREKGLYDKPHFQSMDEVGATAISWTLGKVVIEASKAVGVPQRPWRPPAMRMGHLDRAMWGYLLVAAVILGLLFNALRKRGVPLVRKRKPGRSNTIMGIPIPWTAEPDEYAYEEGGGSAGGNLYGGRRGPGSSRLRMWSMRVQRALRRNVSFSGIDLPHRLSGGRQASMPLSTGYAPGWHSQPSSPGRGNGDGGVSGFSTSAYSTPACNSSARSFSSMVDMSHTPVPSSPPRRGISAGGAAVTSARPQRPRTVSAQTSPYVDAGAGGNGWNDPPMNMLYPSPSAPGHLRSSGGQGHGHANQDSQSGDDEWPARSGIAGLGGSLGALGLSGGVSSSLTPAAGPGGEHALSRNSSRVNLSEMGLAQRTASRAGTPHAGFVEKM